MFIQNVFSNPKIGISPMYFNSKFGRSFPLKNFLGRKSNL